MGVRGVLQQLHPYCATAVNLMSAFVHGKILGTNASILLPVYEGA